MKIEHHPKRVVFRSLLDIKVTQLNWILLVLWIYFLGVQIELKFLSFRFAPSDFFMVIFWALNLLNRKVNLESFISSDLILMLLVFTISSSIGLLRTQTLLTYTIINKYVGLLILIFSFFFIKNVIKDSEPTFKRTLSVIVFSGGMLNILYIFLLLVFPGSSIVRNTLLYGQSRLRGLLVDPNAYGGFLSIIFLLGLYLLIEEKNRNKKIIYSVICITTFIGIILTFSRSALLGFFVGLIIATYFYKELRKYFFVALCVFVLCLLSYLNKTATFKDIVYFLMRPNTIKARLDFIVSGLELFSKHPIFGIGLGSYFAITGVIIHNTYIWFLVEMGTVGFFILILFLLHILQTNISLIKNLRKTSQDLFSVAVGLFSAILAVLVYGVGIEFLYQRYLWLFFALLQALLVIYKKEVNVNI
jgi:O-antigen ligase